jgi:hypothetical protein
MQGLFSPSLNFTHPPWPLRTVRTRVASSLLTLIPLPEFHSPKALVWVSLWMCLAKAHSLSFQNSWTGLSFPEGHGSSHLFVVSVPRDWSWLSPRHELPVIRTLPTHQSTVIGQSKAAGVFWDTFPPSPVTFKKIWIHRLIPFLTLSFVN